MYEPPTSAIPTSSAPVAPRRSRRTLIAGAVAAVLLLGLIGNGVAVVAVRGRLQSQTTRLDADLVAKHKAQAAAKDALQARFQQADLPRKLQTVRDRTTAESDALYAWGTGGQPLSGLKTIREARNACQAAVIDYDATAAQFPAELLVGLPDRINLSDKATDCGR
ncbi:hypothetical protein [Dactylosporangium sp. NPDC051541]|uniref:hypothetical protein n=1 Tax=Dactylosporangium sp. NPDC051541 TaxID=3363977 RepID=UPI00379D2551